MNDIIRIALAAHGFHATGLGGNTIGYVRSDGQILEQITTPDLLALADLGDVVTVSTLEVVGDGGEVVWEDAETLEGYTVTIAVRTVQRTPPAIASARNGHKVRHGHCWTVGQTLSQERVR